MTLSSVPIKSLWAIWALVCGVLAIWAFRFDDPESWKNERIYDESADGSNQIADALAAAKRENKRALLQFGANWCVWCHKLHDLFESDREIEKLVQQNYIIVLIDVNGGHNSDLDERYGRPTRFGLPAIVVLNSAGEKLVTQDTGELASEGRHDRQKVLDFLAKWKP